jgi:multiple sugar transport system substrate-binding protein
MIRSGHGRRRPAVALSIVGVLAAGAIATAPAAFAQDAAKPYEGVTLNLSTYSEMPDMDFYKNLMSDFTEKTGINVNFQQYPISHMDQKVPLQLGRDASLDVFFTGSENIGRYLGVSGVEPLDAYINDPALTPAEWEFADIAPAVEKACQSGGVTYCIAARTGGGLLYYNTRMFDEAGITAPPQTPAELLDYAKKLTTDEHAGFCSRASINQALYDAFQLWQWFYPYDNPVTGNYFREADWSVLLAEEPYASEFGAFWRELLTTSAPEGIATFEFPDCLQAFQQGRVAMWHDDSGAIPEVLNPEKSLVAEETAFHSLPCTEVNPVNCGLVQPFGTWINSASENKEAAWLLVQYLTSKETQAAAAQAGALLTPSRLSVLSDPATVAKLPATFPEALTHILENPNITLLPFIPEGVDIIPPIQQALQELITTDRPVAEIMAQMGEGIEAIMTASDPAYPNKPFPEYTE